MTPGDKKVKHDEAGENVGLVGRLRFELWNLLHVGARFIRSGSDMFTTNPRSVERLASFSALQITFSVLIDRDYFTYHEDKIVSEYERHLPHISKSHDINNFTYWKYIDIRGLYLSQMMPPQLATQKLDNSTRDTKE